MKKFAAISASIAGFSAFVIAASADAQGPATGVEKTSSPTRLSPLKRLKQRLPTSTAGNASSKPSPSSA